MLAVFRRFIAPRVLLLLVAPIALGTLATILMLWLLAAAIPVAAVWIAIALQAIVWISTVAIQIPIQIELGAGGAPIPLIERLTEPNCWFRRVPYAGCAVVFFWMASRALRSGGEVRAA